MPMKKIYYLESYFFLGHLCPYIAVSDTIAEALDYGQQDKKILGETSFLFVLCIIVPLFSAGDLGVLIHSIAPFSSLLRAYL